MNLTYEELVTEIYNVLRKFPNGKDLEVSQKCAWELLRADRAKEPEDDG